jgi:hypothetical protein
MEPFTETVPLDTDELQTSSHITSELESHRLRAQEAQADVTQHLSHVLDVAVQIDRSHDSTLAASMALDQQNQVSLECRRRMVVHADSTKQIAYTLARNAETARALHRQTEVLLQAIFTVTENVTDAARTVSEFHNDIHNLPTKVIQQVFEASLGGFPFGCASAVIFFVFWCASFAALDTWGPFRVRGSVIASLGMAIGKGLPKTRLIIH